MLENEALSPVLVVPVEIGDELLDVITGPKTVQVLAAAAEVLAPEAYAGLLDHRIGLRMVGLVLDPDLEMAARFRRARQHAFGTEGMASHVAVLVNLQAAFEPLSVSRRTFGDFNFFHCTKCRRGA